MNPIISQLATEIEKSLEEVGQKQLMSELALELSKRSVKSSKTRVISAFELTIDQRQKISTKLKTEEIVYLTDPTIIGGLIVEQDGKRQDMSLKRKVNLVKNTIIR
ncbi:MAG: hypothetical protein UT11_C0026G0007 [Berkelbacteria bacterium GW2011_GWA2_38_9]|uniref:Uncharacterized protein n=1 Tax=Berkelbacteria bacterium GW2011_GWA2_38_9 TaxID=1618334 RepID=A0A0G0LN73_9BACT|nr:MAG: hypothetical protein UT11_C0026G0007 [Berkelbacteria bacterium GW2011_GWA2_38_9]